MSATVVEYGGYPSGRPYPYLKEPPLAVTVYSTGAGNASTAFLQAGTVFVELYATAGLDTWWVLFSGSTSSTSVATSTNAPPIAPGAPPKVRAVTPGSRYTIFST